MPRKKTAGSTYRLEAELATLHEISTLVQLSEPDEQTFEKILKLISNIIDFSSASLFLISMATGRLSEAAKLGRGVDLIGFVNFDMGMGMSAWVAKEKRPVILNNLRKSHNGVYTRSFMSVPMIFKDELIGVINFAHEQTDAFTQRDLQIVGIIGAVMAVSIERMIFNYRMAKKNAELIDSAEKLSQAQAKLADFENKQNAADMAVSLNQEIDNPLAIIAGNAQFLLMTMKGSNQSIVKRLKAIDESASKIAQIIEKFRQLDSLVVENRHQGHARRTINIKKSKRVGART